MVMAMTVAGGRRIISKILRAARAPLPIYRSLGLGHVQPQLVDLNQPKFSEVGLFRALHSRVAVRWRREDGFISARSMSCCAGLGAPPPREIIVEYGEEEDNTDYFIQLADAIEEAYPELVVLGNPENMQCRKGSFEVTLGGQVLFSKLQENRLPTTKEILVAIDALPPVCQQEASVSS